MNQLISADLWETVATAVGTRTAEQCCQKHLELRSTGQRGKRHVDEGDEDEGDSDEESGEDEEKPIRIGKKGTISRRRAVREILQQSKKVQIHSFQADCHPFV